MLTTLIVTQILFDVGILVLVVVSFHWLHEKLRDGSQVDAVLKAEEWGRLKEDMDRLASRLETRTEEGLSKLEARIEEARLRAEDLSRACGAAAEETEAALRAASQATEALLRAGELRSAAPEVPVKRESPRDPEREGSFAAVYLLADEMTDIIEISRRTGLSQGEVEMILNLRSARAPGGRGGLGS